jgi:tricorn protease
MKKTILLFLSLWVCTGFARVCAQLLWMQQPAISPNGQWIAFEYKSNIYKVPAVGGTAIPLTFNNAYNGYPVWSHDGSRIAFASNRYGNFDVYIMSAEGGEAHRLTFDSAKDLPYDFSPDNNLVYFGTDRHDIYTSARFPGDNLWMKLYEVPAKGGRNVLVNSAGSEYVHINKAGDKFIFQDRKGTEDPWRKHHRSAVTRDIWVYNNNAKTYTKIADFDGEDREPVWGDGNTVYYLSERNGNQNLFRSSIDQPEKVVQLTLFTQNPVRNLSRSANGIFAFTQNGELYTMQEGRAMNKLNITFTADFNAAQIKHLPVHDGATEMALSPNGKEIAFVVRGEIFVTAINGTATRRITNSSYREGMVSFSPDGRKLIYSAEKDGLWDIYTAIIRNKNEPYFSSATSISIEAIIARPENEFGGIYAPDGKSIAYITERNVLSVYNIEKHTSTTLLPEGNNFSFTDGDQEFSWSPDSRYIMMPSQEGRAGGNNLVLIKADGSTPRIKIVQSGFDLDHPQWGINGKVIYYLSDKLGLKSLSQGPKQADVYAAFLEKSLFDNFQFSNNELTLRDDIHKRDSLTQAGKIITPHPNGVLIDYTHIEDRTIRLSQSSGELADARLSPDGEKLYTLCKYDNNFDLWVTTPRAHNASKLTELGIGSGKLEISKDGKSLFVLGDGRIFKIDPENGNKTLITINSSMELNAVEERASIFEHVYRTMPKKFFDPKLQGVDWEYYHNQYARFLPHINNNYDFQLLLSEFLGELNSSHTGSRYTAVFPDGDETAALGLLFRPTAYDNGLYVAEVLEGGPFDLASSQMKKGDVIDKIDGVSTAGDVDWAPLLNHKKAQLTLINFHDPKTRATYQEVVKPIAIKAETNLLYKRWTHLMEHLTDSLSEGKVGYVHIRAMDDPNFRIVLDQVKGKNESKKALIIDTRFNTGGNLHEQLIKLFSNKTDLVARPQSNTPIGDDLPGGSFKPTCVLISEGNYSDGYNFPYVYQRLRVGKLIGTPVAGTGTGVFWENQIDESIIVGFPEIGLSWTGESALLENHQIEPDIKVYNSYSDILNGRDLQLERAVKEMLKTIKEQ